MTHPVALPEDPDVRAAFTSRDDGNLSLVVGEGEPRRARRRVLHTLGADPAQAVFMQQVHGGAVARVDRSDGGRGLDEHADAVGGVDALVTDQADVALAVLVADCVPVLLCDPGRAVGAVHAGRRGVVGGVIGRALDALTADRSAVVAVIGPAIGGCCYEVPAEMAEEVAALVPAAKAATTRGTPSLDLRAAVAAQLEDAGVTRVEHVGGCTFCDGERSFSHRAVSAGRAAGRQAGLIVRTGRAAPRPATHRGRGGANL